MCVCIYVHTLYYTPGAIKEKLVEHRKVGGGFFLMNPHSGDIPTTSTHRLTRSVTPSFASTLGGMRIPKSSWFRPPPHFKPQVLANLTKNVSNEGVELFLDVKPPASKP